MAFAAGRRCSGSEHPRVVDPDGVASGWPEATLAVQPRLRDIHGLPPRRWSRGHRQGMEPNMEPGSHPVSHHDHR